MNNGQEQFLQELADLMTRHGVLSIGFEASIGVCVFKARVGDPPISIRVPDPYIARPSELLDAVNKSKADRDIVVCQYCHGKAERVTGKEIYPSRRDLWGKKFLRCQPCGAYVGCHDNTGKPLGTLANSHLRTARKNAHTSFDCLWRNGAFKRHEAYGWLQNRMGLSAEKCHIGSFDVQQCRKVVDEVNAYKQRKKEN